MSLKNLVGKIGSFLENKYASLLLFIASFFMMLSAKVTPIVYAPLDGGILNPIFDIYEIFPINLFDYLLWILIFIALKVISNFITQYICAHNKVFVRKVSYKVLIGIALFLFLAWLPYFLAFYPGTSMQDEIFAMRDPFGCSNQPLFYGYMLSFLWDFGKFFGDETLGFGIFSVVKMLLMAFSLSYLLTFLFKRGISKYFLILFAVFFAFSPIFPNYAICIFKDTPFAIFILLLTLFLYEQKRNYETLVTKNYSFLIFLFLALMIIWLRSNGLHIMLFLLVILAYLSKKVRLRFFILGIIFILAGSLPNHGRHVPFKEAVGIPIQQVARTLNVNGKISEENKEIFNNIMGLSTFKERYLAFNSDMIKWDKEFNNPYLNGHKKDFIKAWILTFPDNISTYFTAHAFAAYDFWAISKWETFKYQTNFIHAITKNGLNNNDIESEGWNGKFLISEKHFLPENLKKSVGLFMNDNVSYLNGGTCGVILLIFMAITLSVGKGRRIVSVLPVFLAWTTILLAAPIASAFRYVFYFTLVMPFILSLPFMTEESYEESYDE